MSSSPKSSTGIIVDEATYASAVLHHADSVLQLFSGERLINKIFGRVFQSHAMGRLVIAHFDSKVGAGLPPTLAQLQAVTGCHRTLAAFIGIAKVARLITAQSNPADRRQKFLVPGPRVIEGLRHWLYHHLSLAESLQMMPPGSGQRLREDEAYFERYVRSSALVIDGIAKIRGNYPYWDWFERHDSGQRMAYALLRAHYRTCLHHDARIHCPININLTGAEVARLLGLSKSHVRNVFNGAERLGILSQDEARRRLRLTAPFLLQARACFEQILLLMVLTHTAAEA